MREKVTVLGGGAMGTACSILLAERAETAVTLWVSRAELAEEIDRTRENQRLLPGIRIPESIEVTDDVNRALSGAELLVVAIPTAFLRTALVPLSPLVPSGCPVVSVVKGLEIGTFLRPSEIIQQTLGMRSVAALCGPSHAEEFARRLPTSVVAASGDAALAQHAQTLFTTDRFRVYTNPDLLGVELAGALKNVVAIAAGICDGLQFGDNAKSALLTRGIAEMTRYGVLLGAVPDTFAGLAGLGDLITTCFSRHSRNRKVGELLGQGATLDQAKSQIHGVAEGVTTCRSVFDLAQQRGLDMPISTAVYQVLFEGRSAAAAAESLMMRPLKSEGR